MALSGSQPALMYARSGLARSAATRSDYYRLSVIVTIEDGGVPVDVSSYVAYNGWHISLNLNDEVDTATLSLLPTLPFTPQTRSQVTIAFGDAGHVEFAGLIMTAQRVRRPGPDPRLWHELTCVDWTVIFDAHLVVADYPAQSATTTILNLVARFTRGSFSTAGVAANLPTHAALSIVNERPSTVLRRITNQIGGGFWIDAQRRLRAWSASIPSPLVDQVPQPLTDDLPTLKTFRVTEDATQQRTRLWVEGQRTSVVLGVPASPYGTYPSLPLRDTNIITAGFTTKNLVRVGTQLGYTTQTFNPVVDSSNNAPGTTLSAPAVAGATTLTVADTAAFQNSGWCQLAGQTVLYTKQSATVFTLPASPAYGSLQAPVGVGAQVLQLPWIHLYPHDRSSNPEAPLLSPGATRIQPDGTPVVVLVLKEQPTIAADLAAREDSDGFYEHLVQDGRYNATGAEARADAELADFGPPTILYEWDTEDVHAVPGVMQQIALTEGTPITTTVRITNVELRPIASHHPPRRSVQAAAVRSAGVLDVWLEDPN
jgi:hypothetical protein